jgi:hypothetical protein
METTGALEPTWVLVLGRPLVVLIFCCAALSGCKLDVAKPLEQEAQWTVVAYDHGREQPSRTIRRDSTEGGEIIKWAKANPDGWSLALPNYVPELLVFSPSFRLTLQSNLALFGTGRLQYSKSISDAEYQRLRQILTTESSSQ